MFRELGNRHLQAHSHDGLASTWYATGDLDRAGQHWERAMALYSALGVPEANRIRDKLERMRATTTRPGRPG